MLTQLSRLANGSKGGTAGNRAMLEEMTSKSRALLLASLGGMLLLTAVTGAAALVALDRIHSGETSLHTRYLEHSAALERIRGGIYLSGTLARDYFVQPDSDDAAALLARLSAVRAETTRAVAPESAQLRGEIGAYWNVLDLMAEVAAKRRGPGVDAYFRRQLAQRRETMLHISADIAGALESSWNRAESDLTADYRRLRSVLAIELAVVIALGLFVSFGTVRRLVRLETETRGLSAQLVRAQEDERRSISRELHDEVGQALSGLLLDVGREASSAESEGARSRLRSMAEVAERTVEAVRRIALSLRPSMLDDLGLVAALEWQSREVGQRTGLNVEVDAEEAAGELPESHRTCIYRIAQEALHNCARHAHAKRVRVVLERAQKAVTLRVEDDGEGFRPGRTRGLGLLGMEERAAQLGGRFVVESARGRGTSIVVELPL